MTREIVLDTETTGMEPAEGHKLIEIGCVELVNLVPSGKSWHCYLNPERDVPPDAVAVHGLTEAFLKDKPTFGEMVGDFSDFIGESRLVIHNAAFDLKFLNAELSQFGFPSLEWGRVTDTLKIAREKFPGSPANLDALCRRFGIDNSERDLHGALLDAQLLAEVYLELLGGRQHGLAIEDGQASGGKSPGSTSSGAAVRAASEKIERPFRQPRPHAPGPAELDAHRKMIESLADPLWKKQAEQD